MKQFIFLMAIVLAFVIPSQGYTQIFPGQKYKREVRRAQEAADKQQDAGWPIVLDPIETVPKKTNKRFDAAGVENWGQRLILPDSIKARLQAQCKIPGQLEIYDTGGKWSHPYLQQGQVTGSSYTGEPSLDDGNGHSTHCAGIAAGDQFGILDALVDNGICKVKPVKILMNTGNGTFDIFARAVVAEDVLHKQIIAAGGFVVGSCSFGGGTALQANVETALKNSTALGDVFYIFAAGNTGGQVNYPGNSPYAITCASLDENRTVSAYSSRGPEVSNAMPGRNINSTWLNGQFAVLSGTSMATPFLAACTFIAKSTWGDKLRGVAAMENYLAKVATDITPPGRDDPSGWGILFVKGILDTDPAKVGGPVDPPPPPPPPTGPPTRETRALTFNYTGKFPMVWSTSGTLQNNEPKVFKVTKKDLAANAYNTVYITRLDLDVNTNLFAVNATETLSAAVKWFFTNRGLMLQANNDVGDAVHWSGYFLDMVLLRDKKLDIKIRQITGEDEKGNSITIPGDRVKPWPLQ